MCRPKWWYTRIALRARCRLNVTIIKFIDSRRRPQRHSTAKKKAQTNRSEIDPFGMLYTRARAHDAQQTNKRQEWMMNDDGPGDRSQLVSVCNIRSGWQIPERERERDYFVCFGCFLHDQLHDFLIDRNANQAENGTGWHKSAASSQRWHWRSYQPDTVRRLPGGKAGGWCVRSACDIEKVRKIAGGSQQQQHDTHDCNKIDKEFRCCHRIFDVKHRNSIF